ncbi:DUF887-domain-containing protein [Tilletiaria anomala UBC 951]|uniref:DUF887-domain-containing protein n=1 Tax=Tilletiaria anomala (strain ATCC 24038 / CBS 436.72 / UBC 951) TaxID=1037660 RepID=A0A066WAA9_TILAU|nr:DUF887-domain-containing protein [Tilletiaria anomala UBC 951]KDN50857.1 DUF887-domain-containing protein [Tilletiaria anomala UBC 951]
MAREVLFPQLIEATRPYCIKYGVPTMAPHVPTILLSLSAWVTIQLASSALSPLIFKQSFAKMNRRTRINWDIHVVSFVHASIVTPAAAAIWWKIRQQGGLEAKVHPLAANRTYGYDYETGQVYAIALGYFIWDTVISLLYEGPAFIAHGVVCFIAFALAYSPVFMYDGLGFLMWEASTPFLNIHWFLDKLSMTGSLAQLINAVFLLGAYVSVRLVFGVYNSFSWFKLANFPDVPQNPPLPMHIRAFYSVGNLTLNSLNFIWFRAMIRAVLKRFQTKPHAKEKLDAQKIEKFVVQGNGDEEFEEEAGIRRRTTKK